MHSCLLSENNAMNSSDNSNNAVTKCPLFI